MDKNGLVKQPSAPDAASVLMPALKIGAYTGKSRPFITLPLSICRVVEMLDNGSHVIFA